MKTEIECEDEILIGRSKFLRNSELWKRIEVHKWGQSRDVGYDVGLVPSIISYFIDNPSLIPQIEGDKDKSEIVQCMHVSDIQRELLPVAFKRNRWYRTYDNRSDVGEKEAERDFVFNRSSEWGLKARAAICSVYCTESGRCRKAYDSYERLQKLLAIEKSSC